MGTVMTAPIEFDLRERRKEQTDFVAKPVALPGTRERSSGSVSVEKKNQFTMIFRTCMAPSSRPHHHGLGSQMARTAWDYPSKIASRIADCKEASLSFY
jgi:hypothetical protein